MEIILKGKQKAFFEKLYQIESLALANFGRECQRF